MSDRLLVPGCGRPGLADAADAWSRCGRRLFDELGSGCGRVARTPRCDWVSPVRRRRTRCASRSSRRRARLVASAVGTVEVGVAQPALPHRARGAARQRLHAAGPTRSWSTRRSSSATSSRWAERLGRRPHRPQRHRRRPAHLRTARLHPHVRAADEEDALTGSGWSMSGTPWRLRLSLRAGRCTSRPHVPVAPPVSLGGVRGVVVRGRAGRRSGRLARSSLRARRRAARWGCRVRARPDRAAAGVVTQVGVAQRAGPHEDARFGHLVAPPSVRSSTGGGVGTARPGCRWRSGRRPRDGRGRRGRCGRGRSAGRCVRTTGTHRSRRGR